MISPDDLVEIGHIFKPHGVKGELSVAFDDPDLDPAELRCLILKMEGLPVPFFIETARRRGEASWLIKFETVDSDSDAMRLAKHDVYAIHSELPESVGNAEEGVFLYDLIGYTVLDSDENPVGKVIDVDDSTANVLLIVAPDKTPDRQVMIPFADELILWLDIESRQICVQFPPGILDLNS